MAGIRLRKGVQTGAQVPARRRVTPSHAGLLSPQLPPWTRGIYGTMGNAGSTDRALEHTWNDDVRLCVETICRQDTICGGRAAEELPDQAMKSASLISATPRGSAGKALIPDALPPGVSHPLATQSAHYPGPVSPRKGKGWVLQQPVADPRSCPAPLADQRDPCTLLVTSTSTSGMLESKQTATRHTTCLLASHSEGQGSELIASHSVLEAVERSAIRGGAERSPIDLMEQSEKKPQAASMDAEQPSSPGPTEESSRQRSRTAARVSFWPDFRSISAGFARPMPLHEVGEDKKTLRVITSRDNSCAAAGTFANRKQNRNRPGGLQVSSSQMNVKLKRDKSRVYMRSVGAAGAQGPMPLVKHKAAFPTLDDEALFQRQQRAYQGVRAADASGQELARGDDVGTQLACRARGVWPPRVDDGWGPSDPLIDHNIF